MPLATWPGVIVAQSLERLFDLNAPLLTSQSSLGLSFALGLGYCLPELPNSFLKRRLGVKEGETSERYKWFFVLLDQADSAFGCMIAYRLLIPVEWKTMILTILFGTGLHLALNVALYYAGIRKNRF